jgi:hypothetical protein
LQLVKGQREQAELAFRQKVALVKTDGLIDMPLVASAIQLGDFDIAGQLLLNALEQKDGRWSYPLFVRLPEQAPDSAPWQKFWSQPEVQGQVELRRKNGLDPHAPLMGSGAKP